jgi:hypothetical protein
MRWLWSGWMRYLVEISLSPLTRRFPMSHDRTNEIVPRLVPQFEALQSYMDDGGAVLIMLGEGELPTATRLHVSTSCHSVSLDSDVVTGEGRLCTPSTTLRSHARSSDFSCRGGNQV